MKKKTILWVLLFIAIVVGGYFIYLNTKTKTSEKETIKIGAVLPLTGKAAFVGNMAKEGLLFAESYINDSILQGTDKQIKIILEDGEGNPTTSLSALNKLLDKDNCKIIFSIISPVDLSILPIQDKRQFLFISHASHPKLSNVNNLVFRHSQTVEQEFEIIDKAIKQDWNNSAYVYINDDYGVSFKGLIKQKSNKYFEYAIDANEGVNKSVIEKIVNKNPKYFVLNGSSPILSQVIKALKEKGYKGEIYTCLGFAATGGMNQKFSGTSLYCLDFNLDIQSSNISQAFEKKYSSKFTPNQIIFFNSALLIGNAIKEGNTTPIDISKFIKNFKEFNGVDEKMIIKLNNDILPPITIKKYEN